MLNPSKLRVELPTFQRCCFFVPLRYGLIAWGYLKLILASFLIAVTSLLLGDRHDFWPMEMIVITYITVVMSVCDIVFTITFIYGCHKKNVKIMKVYYFYSQFLLVVTVLWDIFNFGMSVYHLAGSKWANAVGWMILVFDLVLIMANSVIQIYILLLIRSEIIKLKNGCQFSFHNHAAEAINAMNNIEGMRQDSRESEE